jgi:hypothetical protein
VDTTPQPGESSLDAPAPPSGASRKPFAQHAGKLVLWSPFAGLFILIVFVATVGEQNAEAHPVFEAIIVTVCWLIWSSGLVLGIVALCRRKTEGRAGVSGRAFFGLTFNALLLGVTIWGAATATKTNGHNAKVAGESLQKGLAAHASHVFVANALALKKKYEADGAALTNPPVLDMSSVKSREDLQAREQVIREYIASSKNMRDFNANAEETYRQELLAQKVAPETLDENLKMFHQEVKDTDLTSTALREADVQLGEAMLKLIVLLETNWGKWQYSSEENRLRFGETNLASNYSRLSRDLKVVSIEMQQLEADGEKLRRSSRTAHEQGH